MTSVAPGAPPAVWADQDPGSGRVTIRQLLSRMGTLCWVELRKLRHDRTELYTRAIQPALWLIIFGETFNRIHAIRTPHGISIGQAITMPLFFSSNALYPTALMPGWLQAISRVNPLSYEVDALRNLLIGVPSNLALDIAVLIGSAVAAIIVASALLPRLAK